jgi:hypothetical protein
MGQRMGQSPRLNLLSAPPTEGPSGAKEKEAKKKQQKCLLHRSEQVTMQSS